MDEDGVELQPRGTIVVVPVEAASVGAGAQQIAPARVRIVMMTPARTTPEKMDAIAVAKGMSRR